MDFLKDTDSPVPAGGQAVAYTSCLAITMLYKVFIFKKKMPPFIHRRCDL